MRYIVNRLPRRTKNQAGSDTIYKYQFSGHEVVSPRL